MFAYRNLHRLPSKLSNNLYLPDYLSMSQKIRTLIGISHSLTAFCVPTCHIYIDLSLTRLVVGGPLDQSCQGRHSQEKAEPAHLDQFGHAGAAGALRSGRRPLPGRQNAHPAAAGRPTLWRQRPAPPTGTHRPGCPPHRCPAFRAAASPQHPPPAQLPAWRAPPEPPRWPFRPRRAAQPPCDRAWVAVRHTASHPVQARHSPEEAEPAHLDQFGHARAAGSLRSGRRPLLGRRNARPAAAGRPTVWRQRPAPPAGTHRPGWPPHRCPAFRAAAPPQHSPPAQLPAWRAPPEPRRWPFRPRRAAQPPCDRAWVAVNQHRHPPSPSPSKPREGRAGPPRPIWARQSRWRPPIRPQAAPRPPKRPSRRCRPPDPVAAAACAARQNAPPRLATPPLPRLLGSGTPAALVGGTAASLARPFGPAVSSSRPRSAAQPPCDRARVAVN